jgi:hypothetical protein
LNMVAMLINNISAPSRVRMGLIQDSFHRYPVSLYYFSNAYC